MDKEDFKLLANAYQFKWHELAIAKFEVYQSVSKYFTVTSIGEAGPNIKRSFIKLTVDLILFRQLILIMQTINCTL